MIVKDIEYSDLKEHYQNMIDGMVELTGIMMMSGDYAKNVLDNMAKAYVKQRFLEISPKLLLTTMNLTESQHKRYEEILKGLLTEEAYVSKVEYGD